MEMLVSPHLPEYSLLQTLQLVSVGVGGGVDFYTMSFDFFLYCRHHQFYVSMLTLTYAPEWG